MSATDGFHVPVIPLVEVLGSTGTTPPAHMVSVVPNTNAGVIFGFTVTASDVASAHWPGVGVNVYVPEFRLSMVDGLHVPFMPSVDVVGNVGTTPPEQIDRLVPKLNVGVMFELTVTANDAVVAHCPAVGVKVYVPEF